jgi:hypothetical protein
MRGIEKWTTLFEKVVVPMTGLIIVAFAASGGPVPLALYPVAAGMIGYPGVRALDRLRRNGGGTSA